MARPSSFSVAGLVDGIVGTGGLDNSFRVVNAACQVLTTVVHEPAGRVGVGMRRADGTEVELRLIIS